MAAKAPVATAMAVDRVSFLMPDPRVRLSLAAVLAGGLVTCLCWPAVAARPAGGEAMPQPATPATSPPALATANLDRPQRRDTPPQDDAIVFPDGSRLPALNGATHPPRPTYPGWLHFTPVVRTVRGADGHDWYEHEDGTRSTSYMVWREDLGRMDAVTDLAAPKPQQPAID
jgi:hypothetical protein